LSVPLTASTLTVRARHAYLTELDRHAAELSSTPQNWMPWNYRQLLNVSSPRPIVSP
jgi:hypothetical protein